MTMSRMEYFNLYCLKLLQHLYDRFPVPADISEDELLLDFVGDELTEAEELAQHQRMLCHIVDFLESEGFLTIQARLLEGGYVNVRLTMKGLAVLGAIPAAVTTVTQRTSLIKRIKGLFEKGLDAGATKLAEELVGSLFSFALRSGPDVARLLERLSP